MPMSSRSNSRVSQLWQVPLFVASLGLFAYAAFLLIDPKPGPTIEQRLEVARVYLKAERPEAAAEQLNQLIGTQKLTAAQQGKTHLMFAEALEQHQELKKISVPTLHERLIEQMRLALATGARPDAAAYRRMGRSFEVLEKPAEALDAYRKASDLDPMHALRLQRKIIDLQLEQGEVTAADRELEEYLKQPTLTDAERGWALGQRGQLLTDANRLADARLVLDEALTLAHDADPSQQGEVNFRLGYAAYKVGDTKEAERFLRVAREQLKVSHPLDADACYYLGKIAQTRGEPEVALSFYQIVIVSHPAASVAPLSRLERGVCRVLLKQDDAGLTDLVAVAKQTDQKPGKPSIKPDVIAGLQSAEGVLSGRNNPDAVLELMTWEQTLEPEPQASFYQRLSNTYEQRAQLLERRSADVAPSERVKRDQQIIDARTKAGDASVAYSRKLTLTDDKGYGDALWRGMDFYDRAGNAAAATAALELFAAERPSDPQTPEALFRLGRAYQSAGSYDKAIAAYQKTRLRFPQNRFASKSAVPLAQAFMAKGPGFYSNAESTLKSVIENNPMLDPSSEEFKQALFELGQLFYRTSRFDEALSKLEEFAKRYPAEERLGQLDFLMADSYRKSAQAVDAKLLTARAGPAAEIDVAKLEMSRRERLQSAKTLYDEVVNRFRDEPPAKDVEKLYYKLSHFYRADCLYDLGQYQEAIKLYDNAAFRFQDDPSALAAYVQIVNAYCRLGKSDEAKTANERAKWLLRRIPPEAFSDGTFSMPKAYWEQWLKWSNDSGMW